MPDTYRGIAVLSTLLNAVVMLAPEIYQPDRILAGLLLTLVTLVSLTQVREK
jgi:hypothetical protein